MATKATYTATAPDGTVLTRKSAHPYVAAVLIHSTSVGGSYPTWGVWGFRSTLIAAEAEARKVRGWLLIGNPEIVVVAAVAK